MCGVETFEQTRVKVTVKKNNSLYSVFYGFVLEEGICCKCKKKKSVWKPRVISVFNNGVIPLLLDSPRAKEVEKQAREKVQAKCQDCGAKKTKQYPKTIGGSYEQ